ncbi:MAG TPA: hypothetical protein VFV39_07635 [Limnobacter sp.]|nr:hypothetical protein [Limnobacter sp.]
MNVNNQNNPNDPLAPFLAALPQIHVPAQAFGNAAAEQPAGQALAQAPAALVHHIPPAAMQAAAPIDLPVQQAQAQQLDGEGTPPGQAIPAQLEAPPAPRRLGPGVHRFGPAAGGRVRRDLNVVFEEMALRPATPATQASTSSTQTRFSPPSVCKPGLKRPHGPDEYDGSPGGGQGQQLRV